MDKRSSVSPCLQQLPVANVLRGEQGDCSSSSAVSWVCVLAFGSTVLRNPLQDLSATTLSSSRLFLSSELNWQVRMAKRTVPQRSEPQLRCCLGSTLHLLAGVCSQSLLLSWK